MIAAAHELSKALSAPVLHEHEIRPYLGDATETRGLHGRADAVVLAQTAQDVLDTIAWCYTHDVPMTPRGGGTGYAGGAVPDGGVVIALEGLRRVRSIEPLQWRTEVESGVTTAAVQLLARENGLYYPPDPGAAEQSQIGGNVATNAGGPHAFKYGVTGAWVTGVEFAIPPGELVAFGGNARKDVAGYDLRSLIVGSEGTLGIVTAVRLKLIPPPRARRLVVAFFNDAGSGANAVLSAMASGTTPAAVEFLDEAAFIISRAAFPLQRRMNSAFVVIAEADGSEEDAAAGQELLYQALSDHAAEVLTPGPEAVNALWRWRDGLGLVADGYRGGKVSEDVCVPVERLADIVASTHEAAEEAGLEACCWGHAGDGNVHSTFMFDGRDTDAARRAAAAAERVFAAATECGGSITGEHGVGTVKLAHLEKQLSPQVLRLQRDLKRLFDPKNLLNPGKKTG